LASRAAGPIRECSAIEPSSLTTTEIAFLSRLRSASRPTGQCQDALTVGALMRLGLVAWEEGRAPGRTAPNGRGSFSLTSRGRRRLVAHEAALRPAGVAVAC